jgi:hypothetical protein
MAFLAPMVAAGGMIAPVGAATAAGTAFSMSSIGLGSVLSGLGTAASVFGSLKQGQAASQAAKYNAAVAENNKEMQLRNASLAGQEGEAAAQMEGMKTRARVAGIAADQGASGVRLNSGSDIDVRSSAASMGELSAINIRSNAARKAYGYQVDASNYQAQANLDRATAKNARTAGYIGALTALGSSAGKSDWGDWVGGKSMNAPNFIGMNGGGGSNVIWD